ncbi:MAG: undecaprenyl-diphosphate phosphatase [Thermocladium sp.]|jgi:undecaprenyl-diphosphatase
MNSIILGIILGLVQGISEWLPISSKTQILLASTFLLGFSFSKGYAFGLFMEIGTIFAAIIYFRKEIYGVIMALVGRGSENDIIMLKYIVVSTIITGVMGVPIYIFIEGLIKGPVIGIPMSILGSVLILDGIIIYLSRKAYAPRRSLQDLSIKDFVIVGLAQGLAALPGVSRSGMTTSALLLLGVKPEDAFRLSFIELIPAALGAIGVTLIFSKHTVENAANLISLNALGISIIVATLISLLLINALLRFARSNRILLLVFTLGIIALISGIISSITGLG